jgi:hypothetical protein
MSEPEEIKKQNLAQADAHDLSKFSVYYLFKYRLIDVKTANICMCAGLSNIQQIIQLFAEGRQNELLIMPHSSKDIVSELKKLCDEFSDPLTVQKLHDQFEERIAYIKHYMEKVEIGKREKLADSMARYRAKEIWDHIDKSVLENYDIKTFIEEQKLSKKAANQLCIKVGFTNVKQVMEKFFPDRYELFKIKGQGILSFNEIEKACYNFLEKVSAQPEMSSVPDDKTKREKE